jgi:hypothetical protein
MLELINSLRPYLEGFYFLAGILMTGGIIASYRQIVLLKADLKTKNERAAAEKAIEACDRYFCSYIPLNSVNYRETVEKKLDGYSGPVGDFSPGSVPSEILPKSAQRFALVSWLPAMNQLESISAYFISGVADECTGFRVMGRSFCGTIKLQYDVISLSRREASNPYWSNAVKLYQLWSPRLAKEEIDSTIREMQAKASSIPNNKISPIGASE